MDFTKRDIALIGISLVVGSFINIMYEVFQVILKTYVYNNPDPSLDPTIAIKGLAGIFSLLIGLAYLIGFTRSQKKKKDANNSNPES